jgi:ABC-2 type transport system permease protein
VLGPLAVLAAFTAAFAGLALRRLDLDAPKRTWG